MSVNFRPRSRSFPTGKWSSRPGHARTSQCPCCWFVRSAVLRDRRDSRLYRRIAGSAWTRRPTPLCQTGVRHRIS
jgi:hypothetical protein